MSFDWNKLSKEKKQAIVLVVMWVVGGIFALYQFVLRPYFADRGDSVGELDELQSQILKAQIAMDSEGKVRSEFNGKSDELREIAAQFIVPTENPLTWVTEKVYTSARMVGIDVQSVAEVGAKSPSWTAMVENGRMFQPYTVRILTECSYAQLLALASALELSNPYLSITGIIVSSQDQDPMHHMVSMVVQWPSWGREVSFEVASLSDDSEK